MTESARNDAIDRAAAMLSGADRVAMLTGAGISAESGVPTFRGADGLWEGHRVEEVATPEAFERDPELVWKFYNLRREKLWTVEPNPGHYALATMEKQWGSDKFTICTQNIDGLHRAAGSQNVLELHGNLTRVRCRSCSFKEDRPKVNLEPLPRCPECEDLLRPDVVWFHEMLPQDVWQQAGMASGECDCFMVIGTSAVVYPAAGLVELAQQMGAGVIEINPDVTGVSHQVDVVLRGLSGEILPALAQRLLSDS